MGPAPQGLPEAQPYTAVTRPDAGTDVCGTISADTTWTKAASPHVVTCDVVVTAGVVLTIEPGATVKFQDFYKTLWVDGTLLAASSAADSVIFTSYKDDAADGKDSNGDGTASVPAPNDWDSVRFGVGSAGSVLDHAILRYGGGDWSEMVYVATPNITLRNNTIRVRARTGSGWTTSSRPC